MCSVRECFLNTITFVNYYCNLETAEQQENVGISSSLISQQTALIADNTEPVISAIEEYTTHDSDAYWEKTTLHHYNNRSVLESVTVVNGSLVLEEGYINTTYAEIFGMISVSTVEIKYLLYERTIE